MGKNKDKMAKPAADKTPKGMKVDKAVKKFRKLEGKLWTREYLLKIAEFDGATIAPANGAAARADAMGTLAGEHHKLLTSEKSVELVRSLARETVAGGKIDDPQLLDEIRVLGRDQREASVIPTEEAEAWTRLTCEADAVWHKAKTANDWASFEPYVDRIVAQLKHQAELMDPKRDPYDVWLDQYERGLSAKSFDAFCDEVKATVVPLVHAIGERGQQPDADFLHARVPEAAQRAMSFDLMKLVGLDLDDTTLAFTEHPFSEGFSVGDARIATHIYEDDCISNVYSIIHEAGHAMYELGVNPAYARTCLEGGTSMGIHESQSRFFENTVAEIMTLAGEDSPLALRRALAHSRMLSSDVSAGFDPGYAGKFETKNAAFMGRGLCFNKYTGSRGKGGSNDADAEYVALIRDIMDDAGVDFQTCELGRVNAGGGGTIAYIMAKYGMNVIDSGVAVLSMHALWEVANKADIYEAYRGYKAFIERA